MFNKNKFKARVVELGLNIEDVAKEISINPATLYRKINGETEFTRKEIQELRIVLDLDISAADKIFFGV